MSASTLDAVRVLAARFAPAAPDPARLASSAELARDLALDSLKLVELLLACQETFAVALPIEALLAGPALTLGSLAGHIEQARHEP
jgi:acyl carrier protein